MLPKLFDVTVQTVQSPFDVDEYSSYAQELYRILRKKVSEASSNETANAKEIFKKIAVITTIDYFFKREIRCTFLNFRFAKV